MRGSHTHIRRAAEDQTAAESHEEPLTWCEEAIPKHNPQYPMSVVTRGRAPSTPGGLAESKRIMAISERNLRIDLQSEDF